MGGEGRRMNARQQSVSVSLLGSRRGIASAETAGGSEEHLYTAVLTHWELAQVRAPGEAKVRLFNPDPADDRSWTAPTVVQIISDDMPFIVDSVTMELSLAGSEIDLMI